MLVCKIMSSLGQVPEITGNVPYCPGPLPSSIGSPDFNNGLVIAASVVAGGGLFWPVHWLSAEASLRGRR